MHPNRQWLNVLLVKYRAESDDIRVYHDLQLLSSWRIYHSIYHTLLLFDQQLREIQGHMCHQLTVPFYTRDTWELRATVCCHYCSRTSSPLHRSIHLWALWSPGGDVVLLSLLATCCAEFLNSLVWNDKVRASTANINAAQLHLSHNNPVIISALTETFVNQSFKFFSKTAKHLVILDTQMWGSSAFVCLISF